MAISIKDGLNWMLVFLLAVAAACHPRSVRTPVGFVNPFIGTGGDGNTFPGASFPFGGVQLSPDTRLNACNSYAYDDSSIIGFSHTHLSGVGEPEYCDILFMPATGRVRLKPGTAGLKGSGYRSAFTHAREKAGPGFYAVHLDDYDVGVELTATQRAGFHRYTYPKTDSAQIIIDLAHPGGAEYLLLRVISDTEVEGLRRSHGWAWDQYVYFVARFSKSFDSFGLALNDTVRKGWTEAEGKNVQGFATFKTGKDEAILVKVGISSVSTEGARKNLESEIPGWDFEAVKKQAETAWNRELSKITVEGGTEEQRTIFYSAMYHAMLSPDLFMDVDGQYRGVDHRIHTANGFTHYTVFSLWDTYRALHPLFSIIDRKRTSDFIKTLLQSYDDGGRLPMWPLAGNYTDDMLGYHAVPVIVDAWMKGIRDYDQDKAFEAVRHIAMLDRLGLKYYKQYGFIPCDREGESVSKTLEYCYDDWCISQMAKEMGREADYHAFHQRAHFWENVLDTVSGFMRGRNYDRSWLTPFDPLVNSAYSEGNAYQYMYVPHDMEGLIRSSGGDLKFAGWLDTLFTLTTLKDHQGSIGQYWHGNEPGHHLPYLYNYAGQPWKTQRLVNEVLNGLYSNSPSGLAGNEDCGQMSAWYILSALGFYPVAPGQNLYVIGSPLFEKATISLENGKKFVIRAVNRTRENYYIRSASLNGQPYTKTYLLHGDIMSGGELVFEMGPDPDPKFGHNRDDRPFSGNGERVVQPPYVSSGELLFMESTRVALACDTEKAFIRYTLDGADPDEQSPRYERPFEISESVTLKMRAFAPGRKPGNVFSWHFEKAQLYPSANPGKLNPGLRYDYFERFFVTTADLETVEPVLSGISEHISLLPALRDSYFGLRFSGYIRVPADGIYTFFLTSNDGSRLFINGTEIIENDGNHAAVSEPGKAALKSGYHHIEIRYFQCGGGKALQLNWEGPGFRRREAGPGDLFFAEHPKQGDFFDQTGQARRP